MPVDALPDKFQDYAKKDAEATYYAWHSMIEGVDLSHLYSEPLQTATALALAELDQTGTRVDTAEALRLLPMFEKDMPELEAALIEAGLAREGVSDIVTDKMESLDEAADTFGEWVIDTGTDAPSIWHPYTGHERWDRCRVRVFKTKKRVEVSFGNRSFHLNFNAIRDRLQEVADKHKLRPPKTDKGYLSMEADWWEDRLPADADDLRTWQKRQKLEKILNTYLRLYSQVDRVFANWNVLGARSGRMSCASPNIQNIPKRKHGIRSVFVPDEGKVFVIADYCAQEMYTLAEVMSQMGIEGPLLRAIEDGIDLHKNTVYLMNGTPLSEVTKADRQAAKAYNFGFPGGLGPASFREYAKANYGVEMTLDEAKQGKRRFMRAYPDIAEYISRMQTDLDAGLIRHSQRGCAQWAQIMGLEWPCSRLDLKRAMLDHESRGIRQVIHNAERSLVVSLPSGRVRKGCVFTEGANTGFQGFASDVSKLGVVKCWLAGLEVKLVVHDEIGVQCLPEEVEETARLLEKCMLDSFIELCPRSGPYAKVEVEAPLERWGAATDKEGQKV
jgi:DNA polymerase I-like protein with 3'-5' exonuclease and polymerase domains